MNYRKIMRIIFHIILSCSALAQTVYIGLALLVVSAHTFDLQVRTGKLAKVVPTDIFTGANITTYTLSSCNHSDASGISDNPVSSATVQYKGKKHKNGTKVAKQSTNTATYLDIQQVTYKAFKLYMIGIYLFYFIVGIVLCQGIIFQRNWKGILLYIISGIIALSVRATFITTFNKKHEVRNVLICACYGVYLLVVLAFMVHVIIRLRRQVQKGLY